MTKDVSAAGAAQAVLPPCTLVLHSPWMNGPNDQYVGVVTDPLLLQCTYQAEFQREVPVVADRFLSFTETEETFWERHPTRPDSALSTEDPVSHQHDLSHEHSATGLVGTIKNSGSIDANDFGTAQLHSAALHSHDATLDRVALNVSEENDRNTHEPLHYEVSAYYVDPAGGGFAVIPAGAIAVSHRLLREAPGWKRMDQSPLRRDPRETDPGYRPNLWWDETVKIVGCLPSKYRKGSRAHAHDVEPHSHPGGSATGGRENSAADDSRGRAKFARPNHGHPVSWVSTAYEQLRTALNIRRHRKMFFYMAERAGAEIMPGMMVPFVPRTFADIGTATQNGDWAIRTDPTAKDFDPLMITSVHPEDINDYDDDPDRDGVRRIRGGNTHHHHFPHSHEFNLGNSTSPDFHHSGGDREVSVAEHDHAHNGLRLYDFVTSGPSINPLKYRRVLFLERMTRQRRGD